MEAKGNVVDLEFKFERGGNTVADVSKRRFRVRDTYGIEVAPGQDGALIIAITVCIDQMGRVGEAAGESDPCHELPIASPSGASPETGSPAVLRRAGLFAEVAGVGGGLVLRR
jgi:hypothetical protein